MRIAIFSDTYAPEVNGVARTLKRYTNYLDTKGIEYRLFVPESRTPVPKVPHIERFMSIPFLFYPDCRLALPNPLYIRQALDEFKPTLIHVATPFNLGLFGLHYGKKHHIPMVASYHTHFDDYLAYYHATLFKKWIWKYLHWFHHSFDRVYVPSESTKQKLIDRDFHPSIDIWGRGVNHQFFSPVKKSNHVRKKYRIKEKNILLYVGRVAPEKDVHIVLETFHALPAHIKKQTHLLLVGDGPLFQSLSAKAHPQITWTGFLEGEALSEVYASSDLFLFPSPTETFGNVVLEAQSSGLPVIGARAGGVQHLVSHGVNGFLCEAKDTKSFAHYTTLLLEQKSLRRSFSEKSRAFALTLSWDEIFAGLLYSFYQIASQKQEISA
ncbi:glycosyltransferase family 1 protein [Alkalihalobacillus oceani]|uniref:glycosyltransferase family 4 protein n=1 Tax=Halalkalibacter oceani TaxID=1653776 RepID=UPI00203DC164|nr:glycosyltransferase family 1 protein [Halalkalibacter oceani]MCM3759883.1 glycosyltransferase family 1 protein [Halalkalibacter oceani]